MSDETEVEQTDEEVRDSGLLIAGAPDDTPPNVPPHELSMAAQADLAKRMIEEIDNHEDGIPFLPLNTGQLYVWSIEDTFLPPDLPTAKPDSNPGVIITFASASDPRGTPVVLDRDRALKFASQVRRHAQTGPSIQQRAQQAGIAVPGGSTGLLLPDGSTVAPSSDDYVPPDEDADDE